MKCKTLIFLIILVMLFLTVFAPYDKNCHPRPEKVIQCKEGFYCISKFKVNFVCNGFDDFIPEIADKTGVKK